MDARIEPLPRGLRALAARPGRLLGRGGAGDRLVSSRRRQSSTRTPASTAAGSSAASATPAATRSTATSMRGRGEQAAIIYDSPRHRHQAHHHLRRAADRGAAARRRAARSRRRQGRPRHPLHADGAGGGDRHARLRAHRRDPFGGVRRLRRASELATRIDDAKPKVILSASCGIEPGRVVAYKPLLDEAIELAHAQAATPASSCSGRRPRRR